MMINILPYGETMLRYATPLFIVTFLTACDRIEFACEPDASTQYEASTIEHRLHNTTYGDDYSIIAHAGGGIIDRDKHFAYTNSLEALKEAIADGKKLLEIDLLITNDNIIVGGHDWHYLRQQLAFSDIANSKEQGKQKTEEEKENKNESPLSYAEFKSLTIQGKYTPVDMSDLNQLFSEHDDLILVTDKIDDYELLLNQFKHHDRLIVECFTPESCLQAKAAGIRHTAYALNIRKTKQVNDFVLNYSKDISMVTFNARSLERKATAKKNAACLMKRGIINLVYSSNDDEFLKNHIGVHASAVYTDYWSVSQKRCTATDNEKCNTY